MLQLLAGVYFPKYAAMAGAAAIVGRIFYARGYTSKKGAEGRMGGAVLFDLGLLAMLGLAVAGGIKQAGLLKF